MNPDLNRIMMEIIGKETTSTHDKYEHPICIEEASTYGLYDFLSYLHEIRFDKKYGSGEVSKNIDEDIDSIQEKIDVVNGLLADEFLIPMFLPKNTITALTGKCGIGKTALAVQIASQVACRELSHFARRHYQKYGSRDAKHVVYASYNHRHEEIAAIQKNMDKSRFEWSKDVDNSKFSVLDLGDLGPLWSEQSLTTVGKKLLFEQCREKDVKLLIIDSLDAAYEACKQNVADPFHFIFSLMRWCRKAECTILFVDHLLGSQDSVHDPNLTAFLAAIPNRWCLKAMLYKEEREDRKDTEDYGLTYLYYNIQHIKTSWYRLEEAMILGPDRNKIWQEGDVWYDITQLYGNGYSDPLSDEEIESMIEKGGFSQETRDALHTRKILADPKRSEYVEV